ncbi:MAG: prepilin-type N-terminal cleavage/methylation domain-containing protein [Planctomycetota bacterium]|nr:prepilin-type N-terminal cleavage/methylation domain-containing protein [Planctomycetota bacterium]
MRTPHRHRGFSLLELLVSLVIVALLVALLLPVLSQAQRLAHRAACSSNLRQIGFAWQAYMTDTEQLPQHTTEPDWAYGGVRFVGTDHNAVADADRPINAYLDSDQSTQSSLAMGIFRDAADHGITERGRPLESVLPDGETCYQTFGTSYRANMFLLNSTTAGIDALRRPLKVAEITAQPSRLLLVGDPLWYYAIQDPDSSQYAFDARWHDRDSSSGNMAAFDGSVRWVRFGALPNNDFTIAPRAGSISR